MKKRKMEWNDALFDFKMYLKLERRLSNNTVENYLRDVDKLKNFTKTLPLSIQENQIQSFIEEIARTNYSPRTQARILSGVKSFFNYLHLEEFRDDNPSLLFESPKLGMKLPDVLSEKEINLLIASIDLSKAEGERNKAMIETLYGCGLRVSELINLKLSDLFFKEGFIRILGKGEKQRLVPIGEYTIKYINLYLDTQRIHQKAVKDFEDFVFLNRRGKSLTRVMIFTIIKNLSKAAGINKNISPHTFRHSYATHLLKNGADLRAIQQMLGHESITTTEIYTHLDEQHLRDSILRFHPRNN